jgi:hypothetical protein
MAATADEFETSLEYVQELESFLHEFLERLPAEGLEDGEDLTPYIERAGLQVPRFIEAGELTYASAPCKLDIEADHAPLVLVRPGHPEVIGLVIRCVYWRGWRICLECGWIWCRIVLTRRF